MTKTRLVKNVLMVIACLSVLVLIAAIARFQLVGSEITSGRIYDLLKDFSSVAIAIAAAYLAYCFQKRSDFISALRELWHAMIDAKNALIAYTQDANPTQAAFTNAYSALSRAIDQMRGVYRNVDETTKDIGWFPFEPLHDMRKSLEALGFGISSEARREAARQQIVDSWNALRPAFLKEFSTPNPTHSITSYGAKDPRR